MNILLCLYLPHNLHTPQTLFAKFGSLQQTQIKADTQIYYLLVKEFTGFLLDGVKILDLPGWETHDESYALCCGRVLVEVMTRGLRPLVDPLVYGLTEVHSLQTTARRQSFSDIQRTKTTNITLLCPFLCFCPSFFFFLTVQSSHVEVFPWQLQWSLIWTFFTSGFAISAKEQSFCAGPLCSPTITNHRENPLNREQGCKDLQLREVTEGFQGYGGDSLSMGMWKLTLQT